MNKDEALNKIIEYCKNGSKTPVSDFCRIPCSVCPFNDDNCENVIADVLTERLIKAEEKADSLEETCYKLQQALEEKKETNLEHYFNAGDVIVYSGQQYIYLNDNCWDAYVKGKTSHIVNWLLLPYEEPKTKYKLSQFEYDLLDSYCDTTQRIKELWTLKNMQDKGYFKNIPTDISIKDILADCEVVEE